MQLQEVIISRDDKIMELTDRVLLLSQPAEQEIEPADDPAQNKQEECREQATENEKNGGIFGDNM